MFAMSTMQTAAARAVFVSKCVAISRERAHRRHYRCKYPGCHSTGEHRTRDCPRKSADRRQAADIRRRLTATFDAAYETNNDPCPTPPTPQLVQTDTTAEPSSGSADSGSACSDVQIGRAHV